MEHTQLRNDCVTHKHKHTLTHTLTHTPHAHTHTHTLSLSLCAWQAVEAVAAVRERERERGIEVVFKASPLHDNFDAALFERIMAVTDVLIVNEWEAPAILRK